MATNRERLKELTDRLEAGLSELLTSEKYAEYLKVMSQFTHYSVNNTMLIALQKPEATLVAAYGAWQKKFKRHVKKGEKGIRIISPAPRKEKVEREKKDKDTGDIIIGKDGKPETEEVTVKIPRFIASTVFDISQTDGEPLPELGAEELTADVKNYPAFMKAIRAAAPCPLRFADIAGSAKGYYSNIDKEIVIRKGMSESQTMKTAVHETVHALLHDRDRMKEQENSVDRQTAEVTAESCAFVVCAHFGLDTSDYSFPYIAGWSSGREAKELKESMDTIRKTAGEIIDGIEDNMREQLKEKAEEREQEAGDGYREEKDEHLSEPLPYAQCAFLIPGGYLAIHTTEEGYDYSFYDKDYKLLDGGVLTEEPEKEPRTIDQAAEELLAEKQLTLGNCKEVSYDKLTDHTDDANRIPPDTELGKLARDIDDFLHDYDTYEYWDRVEDRDQNEAEIMENLNKGITAPIREYLETAMKEVNHPEAASLLQRLEHFEHHEEVISAADPLHSYFVAECMEFPVMGEYHDHLTLEEAAELYEAIPSDRMHGIKGIGIDLDDGSIYAGSIDLMQGGLVDKEIINSIDHYRESPLVQQALQELADYYPDREQAVESSVVKLRPLPETPQDKTQDPGTRDSPASSKKESVLQALKERQAKVKTQDEHDKQTGEKEKKKGELTL